MTTPHRFEVLLSRSQIAERVAQLGRDISRDHAESPPILLGVLKGSFVFLADLIRAIESPLHVEFLGVQSYGDGTTSGGAVQITQDLTHPVRGRDVVVVEDIIDTGLTAHFLIQQLAARQARGQVIERRLNVGDYLGFTIDDVFVVGYGLDHAQAYRNLPDICELSFSDP